MIHISILRAMVAAGASIETLLAAIEADQIADTRRTNTRRADEAARQAEYRARKKAEEEALSRDVTACHSDSRDTARGIYIKDSIKEVEEKERGLPSKEVKKERKKILKSLPENWEPSENSKNLALELGLELAPIVARFRDYCASSGKLYANHDAALNNFIRNTPHFGGGKGVARVASSAATAVSPGTPEFEAWRTFFRDTGKRFSIKQMDECSEWGKPMTVPSPFPPGHERAA